MKKQDQKEKYQIEDFDKYCHLWNIVIGGSNRAIVKLRSIVDSLQADNYSRPYSKMPSLLLVGEKDTGKYLTARATVNSLAIDDLREIPAEFIDNGISSWQFFQDSSSSTAHIILDVDRLNRTAETVMWRYLKEGKCKHYNYNSKSYDLEQWCYGLILMTARDKNKLSGLIVDAVDFVIELEPFTHSQLEIIIHQYLKFCDIEYQGEEVLQEIVNHGQGKISYLIEFLKTCLMLLKTELKDDSFLNMEIVERARRLSHSVPAPPIDGDSDMPF